MVVEVERMMREEVKRMGGFSYLWRGSVHSNGARISIQRVVVAPSMIFIKRKKKESNR